MVSRLSLEHPKNWLKGQALLSILISLCLLVTFSPQASRAIGSISGPISISSLSQYVMLPIPSGVGGSLWRAKTSKNDASIKSVSAHEAGASAWRYECFIPIPPPFFNCVSDFEDVFREDFQQACSLLDIPPPSPIVSSRI